MELQFEFKDFPITGDSSVLTLTIPNYLSQMGERFKLLLMIHGVPFKENLDARRF